jgi:HAD superfamily hydrolase (TIGR01509 family)
MSPITHASRDAGIVFDFNGVLFWDSHLQEQAWRELSSEVRGHPFSDEEMLQIVHGRTNSAILEYLLGHPLTDVEQQELAERKEGSYRRTCLAAGDAFQLSPGAIPLLDTLKREGAPLTIATSSPGPNVEFFIEHLGLERWFDPAQIVYDDGTFPGKPAPDIYERAAARLGVEPSACMVVEDAVSGIEAARRAGIGEIIALGPTERHDALRALTGVSAVITRLDELRDALLSRSLTIKVI